jgi:hypothetical protein
MICLGKDLGAGGEGKGRERGDVIIVLRGF